MPAFAPPAVAGLPPTDEKLLTRVPMACGRLVGVALPAPRSRSGELGMLAGEVAGVGGGSFRTRAGTCAAPRACPSRRWGEGGTPPPRARPPPRNRCAGASVRCLGTRAAAFCTSAAAPRGDCARWSNCSSRFSSRASASRIRLCWCDGKLCSASSMLGARPCSPVPREAKIGRAQLDHTSRLRPRSRGAGRGPPWERVGAGVLGCTPSSAGAQQEPPTPRHHSP